MNIEAPMSYECTVFHIDGKGNVSDADPVDKKQKFDTLDDVKEKRIERFQKYAKKTLAALENVA